MTFARLEQTRQQADLAAPVQVVQALVASKQPFAASSRNEAAERVVRLVQELGRRPISIDDCPEEIDEDDVGVVCWMAVLPA